MVSNIILLGMRLYIRKTAPGLKTCADAVRSKEEAFIEWKSNTTPENELPRKEARNRCNAVLKQQQFLHEQKLRRKVLDYSKGSKNFWSFVKTVKNAETSSLLHFIKDGQTFTHSVDKANILAEMFSKNSSLAESDQPQVHIRTSEVKRVLVNLDIKKSSGPDGIPARVPK